jgi:replicative DNA helicase
MILGSDFDEPESHIQDSSKFKVKCGFETIDHMLGGGWDVQTLNVIMAETNGGKCTFFDTVITIRNKENNEIVKDKIEKIFSGIGKRCVNNFNI